MDEEYANFDQMAINGILHPIDKILVYNENEMYGNILNERIRIDLPSLVPELSCNDIRYNTSLNNNFTIPRGYSDKLKISSGVVNILGGYAGYNADMFVLDDDFDVEFTLPPLPPRVYEVRVGLFQNGWATPMGSEEAVQASTSTLSPSFNFPIASTPFRYSSKGPFALAIRTLKLVRGISWGTIPPTCLKT